MSEPVCTCRGCGRRVACIRVSDGTLYKPTAWLFPKSEPLSGWCGACRLAFSADSLSPDEHVVMLDLSHVTVEPGHELRMVADWPAVGDVIAEVVPKEPR